MQFIDKLPITNTFSCYMCMHNFDSCPLDNYMQMYKLQLLHCPSYCQLRTMTPRPHRSCLLYWTRGWREGRGEWRCSSVCVCVCVHHCCSPQRCECCAVEQSFLCGWEHKQVSSPGRGEDGELYTLTTTLAGCNSKKLYFLPSILETAWTEAGRASYVTDQP